MRSPSTHRRGMPRGNLTKSTGPRGQRRIVVHRPGSGGGLPREVGSGRPSADEQPIRGVGEVARQLVHHGVRVRRPPPESEGPSGPDPAILRLAARHAIVLLVEVGCLGTLGGGVPDPPHDDSRRPRGAGTRNTAYQPAGGRGRARRGRRRRATPPRSAAPRLPAQTRESRQRSPHSASQRHQPQRRLHRERPCRSAARGPPGPVRPRPPWGAARVDQREQRTRDQRGEQARPRSSVGGAARAAAPARPAGGASTASRGRRRRSHHTW